MKANPFRFPRIVRGLALLGLVGLPIRAEAASSEGLWVGRAYLGAVNEVVSAVDENNVRVQEPPDEATPTSDQAEILLILHVDAGGQVRLLKSVAIADTNDDPLVVEEALITDPRLFTEFTLARRIASVAFEFGDPASRTVVGDIATEAALAAAASATSASQAEADAIAAAQAAIDLAVENAGDGLYSDSLAKFVGSASFKEAAEQAGEAAAESAVENYGQGLRGTAAGSELVNAVRSDVLIALGTVSQMADGASLNEVEMTGSLEKGGTVECTIFLGAYHPANPFRHRRHPSHRGGFDIERRIKLVIPAADPENEPEFDSTDRGLDRLSGTYEEEIFGLHKPLGQDGEFGLLTKGGFVLDRISDVATLNADD